MNCPVCNRDLAPTLSICLTCGAMMNDSVREELQTKIATKPPNTAIHEPAMPRPEPVASIGPVQFSPPAGRLHFANAAEVAVKRAGNKIETTELDIKNTCQTLMDFQNKNAALPDWRIQLQNSVRQRKSGITEPVTEEKNPEVFRKKLVTRGANALKPDIAEEVEAVKHEDPLVLNALKRIEASRRTFMPTPEPAVPEKAAKAVPNRTYPFNVISRTSADSPQANEKKPEPSTRAKPQLVSKLRIEKRPFDTNKLPPLTEPAPIAARFEAPGIVQNVETPSMSLRVDAPIESKIVIHDSDKFDEATNRELDALHFGEPQTNADSQDDLATVSMRFGAGLFDVIIGGFGALILLSPFAFAVENWFTVSGAFAFAGAFSIMLFLYTTASLTRYGRTLGMRLFSLEMIDSDDNVYPTLHQSAVSSAVYLLSLAFAGIGFIPMFFNSDKQAAHDLISGTVVVREL